MRDPNLSAIADRVAKALDNLSDDANVGVLTATLEDVAVRGESEALVRELARRSGSRVTCTPLDVLDGLGDAIDRADGLRQLVATLHDEAGVPARGAARLAGDLVGSLEALADMADDVLRPAVRVTRGAA